MSISHEAYLFKPSDFAKDILPYAKALAQNRAGEKSLLDTLIERFANNLNTSWLAMEYGGWDISYIYDAKYSYENVAEAHRDDRLDVGRLLVFMIYGHLHPIPSRLGLRGLWSLMEGILAYPLGWHSSDRSSLIHGHSFGYFAQLWIASELGTTDNRASNIGYWENVTTGSTAAQIGWLDYPDAKRFLYKLTEEELNLPKIKAPHDPSSIRQVYNDTVQMLRSASEAECGLCIITSG